MKTLIPLFISLFLFPAILYAAPPNDDYKLIWSDEFDGKKLDMKKWSYRGLGPRRDAINVKDTVNLNGEGQLILTTKKSGDQYHTAMIATHGKFEACFGYFECRVKFQTQIGHWSAFWLQSPKLHEECEPSKCGTEIDIFEYLVKNKNVILFNLHWGGYGDHHKTTGSKYEMKKTKDGYHTIGLEWTPNYYTFFVDDKKAWTTDKAISRIKQYIILSLEVGEWAGDISQAKLPDNAYFDYIRVYQKK